MNTFGDIYRTFGESVVHAGMNGMIRGDKNLSQMSKKHDEKNDMKNVHDKGKKQKNGSKKTFVNINETAAQDLADPNDQKVCLKIIHHFTANVTKTTHGPIENAAKNIVYYTVRFRMPMNTMINFKLLSSLVANLPNSIREIEVKWPDTTKSDKGISIRVQVFSNWITNNNGKPGLSQDINKANPVGLDLPNYQFVKYRDTESEKILRNANVLKSDKVPTWDRDISILAGISDDVHNSNEILPQIQFFISINLKLSSYSLRFSNMENIRYSFLEYLLEKFPVISNIQFNSNGTTTRDMIITVSYKNDNHGLSPVYSKRFSTQDQLITMDQNFDGPQNGQSNLQNELNPTKRQKLQ